MKLIDNTFQIDYSNPKKMTISGVVVDGIKSYDPNAILLIAGFKTGDIVEVPGVVFEKAIRNLWKQGLFSDIEITFTKVEGNNIFLNLSLNELPKLSKFNFKGVSKSEAEELRDLINLFRNKIVNEQLKFSTKSKIKNYFIGKGFFSTKVIIKEYIEPERRNYLIFEIQIDKNKKTKIKDIEIVGNENISTKKIKKQLKETKEKSRFHIFKNPYKNKINYNNLSFKEKLNTKFKIRLKSSRFIRTDFEKDKQSIIKLYNKNGFRDAEIISDTVYLYEEDKLNILLKIKEGKQYYFRNINWVGNTKYSTKILNAILNIKKGQIYNVEILESKLYQNPSGLNISSLYMDDGYLFFQVAPVEKKIEKDSIDIEIRIFEGNKAVINKIIIKGNNKTNDYVIRREIRTKPNNLFNYSELVRTHTELSLLGYFDPQSIGINPIPNPQDGTVNIEYSLVEKPNDQIKLQGGFGNNSFLGTLGLTLNNLSTKKFFNAESWSPIPSGDGQKLTIQAQSNGLRYRSYNISFTEPWLGGKKPNSFTLSAYYTVQTNGITKSNPDSRYINIIGGSIGLGKRLKWPDDKFQLYQQISFQNYEVFKWTAFQNFNHGTSNNFFYKFVISRSSINDLYYPTDGALVSFTGQITPPYSKFNNKDYSSLDVNEQFKFLEYYKWKFTSTWYKTLAGNKNKLVLYGKVGFAFLSKYDKKLGSIPFERFYLGGSGLTGYVLDGREIISLRGYNDQSVAPAELGGGTNTGGAIINKYTMELRFPLSLNPQAMIWTIAFVEGGNTWNEFKNYNPFEMKRSAGIGVRIFLPVFGMFGVDWGYRYDDIIGKPQMQKSQIHFTIGGNIGEL